MKLSPKQSFAALALVAAGGLGLWSMEQKDQALPLTPFGTAQAQDIAATQTDAIEIKDMTLGQEDAPVTLIEYASYTCPHCANFHEAVFRNLKRDYIDTGKVKFVYREVYFDRYGLWAAMVARCGGDMRYFGIQEMLYKQQSQWAASNDATTVVGNLKTIGRAAGMDDATLDACLQNGAMAQALVDHYEKVMAEYSIQGTPSLVINGKVHSNMTYDELKKILDAALAG